MRAFLPAALVVVFSQMMFAAETVEEIAAQLLRGIETERIAAEKKSANDQATTLRQATAFVRQHPARIKLSDFFRQNDDSDTRLSTVLKDFPDLAKLAATWESARNDELAVWEKAACAEMEKGISEATTRLRTATQAAELDETQIKLEKLARKYPPEQSSATAPVWVSWARGIAPLSAFIRRWQEMLAAQTAGQRHEALEKLSNLFQTESLPGLSDSALIGLLNDRAGKLGMPSTDQAEETVRNAIGKAMAASKPIELDPLLEQMNRSRALWENVRMGDGDKRSLARLAEVGRDFVARWQDLLALRASGQNARAAETIKELVQTAKSEPVYPRAKLFEAAAALRAVGNAELSAPDGAKSNAMEQWLAGIKTLENLEAHISEVTGDYAIKSGEYGIDISDLEEIAKGFTALRVGNFREAGRATFGGFNRHSKVVELRSALTMRLAAAMLRADGAQAPRAGEGLREFVQRLATDALQRKDWQRLRKVLETPGEIPGQNDVVQWSDSQAVRAFVAGHNLDEVGVWAAAVASYVEAVNYGSAFAPIEEIKQRLVTIRREHPEDYQHGSEQASPPRRPQSTR
jgi:hypothetical protein